MVKRYLVVKDALSVKLPHWFSNHQGKKYIHLYSFVYVYSFNDYNLRYSLDRELHSDLVEKDPTYDGYLCNSGTYDHRNLKWEIFTDRDEINFKIKCMNDKEYNDYFYKAEHWTIHLMLETVEEGT